MRLHKGTLYTLEFVNSFSQGGSGPTFAGMYKDCRRFDLLQKLGYTKQHHIVKTNKFLGAGENMRQTAAASEAAATAAE